jgi:hypothetical protein
MLVQVITLLLLPLRENTAKSIVVAVFEATRDFPLQHCKAGC